MRMLFSGLIAAGLLTSQAASAACVPMNDREALDVAGLKSQLMVVTLTCKTDSQYNAFINKFKTELNSEERTAHNYFNRTYGHNGQKRQDEFITQLANSKSDAGLRMGNRFCAHNEEIFNEVLALKNEKELEEYAAGRITEVSPTLAACAEGAEPTRAATRTTSHSSRRRRS